MRFRSCPPPPQIQRAQGEHGGEEDDAHDAEVDEQPHAHAAEQERAQRVAPEGAVGEPERDHERGEEGDVLRVEERVRVDAGMQQEQEHGDDGERSAAEQTQGEQVAEDAAREEGQVREQMPDEVEVPAVIQTGDAFEERERRLERDAVVAVGGVTQLLEGALAVPREVVQRGVPDRALVRLVRPDAVVVQRERGRQREEHAHERQRPVGGDRLQKGDPPHTYQRNHSRECSSRAFTPRRGARTPPSTARPRRRTGPCARWRWGSRAGAPRPRSSRRGAPRASPA